MPILIAHPEDIPDLVALIDNAYRGDGSKAGWTSEADFFSGNKRTDLNNVEEMMNTPGTVFLNFINAQNKLEGCVCLRNDDGKLYLGMLSVDPKIQTQGIGKQLLKTAEDYAKMLNCPVIYMKVISIRKELIAWYERHGYHRTGETEPFPIAEGSGAPLIPLEMILLEKIV